MSGVLIRSTRWPNGDRKSTRLNSSHSQISYAVFCLKKQTDGLIRVLDTCLRGSDAAADPVERVRLAEDPGREVALQTERAVDLGPQHLSDCNSSLG